MDSTLVGGWKKSLIWTSVFVDSPAPIYLWLTDTAHHSENRGETKHQFLHGSGPETTKIQTAVKSWMTIPFVVQSTLPET